MQHKVILLGHTGFIGGHVLERLKTKGVNVLGLDQYNTDLLLPKSISYLSKILTNNATLVITVAVNRELGDNPDTLESNIKIIANIARALENRAVKKCIFLSSADVYGIPRKAITEETPISPQTYYATAKYCCERLLEATARRANFPLLILRYNGVFGPGQKNIGYGPNAFIKSIAEKKEVVLWGKGEELRDTLFVKDLAEIICRLTLSKESGIYNIAKGKSLSFAKMVKMLQKIVPKKFKVVFKKRTGVKFNQVFDTKKLSKALPKFPFTLMEEALRKTYREYTR